MLTVALRASTRTILVVAMVAALVLALFVGTHLRHTVRLADDVCVGVDHTHSNAVCVPAV